MDAIVRRAGIISFELCNLLIKNSLDSSWPKFFLGTGTKLRKLLHFIHTKFFLDGLELIVKEILPLLLIDFRLYLLVDLLFDLLQLHLCIEN